MTRNNHIKAQETLNFLNDHPAFGGFIFPALSLLELSIVEVCKRGYCKPQRGCISIYYNPKNYRRFKAEFDKEFEGYTEAELKQQKSLIRIDVPYKRLFGETWKADHVEYWGELPFLVFTGRDFRPYHDRKRWTTCCGVEGCGQRSEVLMVQSVHIFVAWCIWCNYIGCGAIIQSLLEMRPYAKDVTPTQPACHLSRT